MIKQTIQLVWNVQTPTSQKINSHMLLVDGTKNEAN